MKKILITAVVALAAAGAPMAVSAQAPTTISLIQGIPTPPNVDITIDGATITGTSNLAQGAIVNFTDYAGTEPSLEVLETGTTDSLMAAETVSVPSSGNNSVIVTTAGPMTFANNLNEVAAGGVRITLRNASTDVASINLVGASQPINGVGLGAEGTLDQASGQLSGAKIIDAGGTSLVSIPTTNLAAGTNTIFFLIGDATLGYSVVQQIIQVPMASDETTTTTTTVAGESTTTTTTTADASSTTSTAVPGAVNTGSPIGDGNATPWILVLVGGLAVAGGAYLVRRRV